MDHRGFGYSFHGYIDFVGLKEMPPLQPVNRVEFFWIVDFETLASLRIGNHFIDVVGAALLFGHSGYDPGSIASPYIGIVVGLQIPQTLGGQLVAQTGRGHFHNTAGQGSVALGAREIWWQLL